MGPKVQHVAYIGLTGHGKTEACISRNGPRMLEKDGPAYLVLDPAGGMVEKLSQYLVLNGVDFIFDEVENNHVAPGYGFFQKSTEADSKDFVAETRQLISDVTGILMRSEGKLNAQSMKSTQQVIRDAVLLYVHQKEDVPFYLLQNCFVDSPEADYLLKNCTNPDTQLRFELYRRLQGQQREAQGVGAVERRLIEICACPQFQARCHKSFDLAAFFNRGGKLLLSGRSKNNRLSREDAALVMGATLLRVIALLRSGAITRPLVICLDEGMNTGLLDLNCARALRQSRQFGGGVEWHLILQTITLGDPEITESVLGMCDILYFFKQVSPAAARTAAEICGTITFDPMRIKEVVTKIRQVHDGVDIQNITHTSESKDEKGNKRITTSEGHISIPRYIEKTEEEIRRMSFDEQFRLMMQILMMHDVGCCTIKDGSSVVHFHEPLPMLQFPERALWPWQLSPRITLGERKLAVYLELLKSHSAYQSPEPFVCTTQKKNRKTAMD